MADNDLFAAPDGAPPTPADTTVADDSRMQGALERALSRTVAPAFQALRQEVGTLKAAQEAAAAPTPASTRPDGGAPDDYTHLIQDPRGFVNKIAVEGMAKQVGPAMQQLLTQTRDGLIRGEAREVDEAFGDGFFDKEIKDKLDLALKEVPIENQANPNIINATVSAILGMAYREPGKLAELGTKRAKVDLERKAATSMLQNGRVVSRASGTKASPEESEFVARLSRGGVDISLGEYVKDRETPGTLSAWRDRMATEAKAK